MTSARLAVGPGTGRLARRADGLLFIGGRPNPQRWEPIVDAYLDAPNADDAREAVTAAAVEAGFDLDPFVMVAWGMAIELLVLGAIEVHTDLPSVPMLSGTASATWVEHRVVRPPATARLAAGVTAETDTRLDAGTVAAGGFALALAIDGMPIPTPASVGDGRAPTATPTSKPGTVGNGPATLEPHRDDAAPVPSVAPVTSAREQALAILDAATGGDWMEESLDLGGPRPATSAVSAASVPADTAIATSADEAEERLDLEMTISPAAPLVAQVAAVTAGSSTPGLVRARRCTRGHPNPPHAAQCRTCGDLLGAASVVEMIAQPALGQVVLPDGSAITVDGTAVLGRKPDTAAARVESTAHLVPLAVDAGVSRTHVVIRAEGWTITATDCGSRGRTVLRSPGADPEALEPWVPHELEPGDTLYLGGPTHVQVVGP